MINKKSKIEEKSIECLVDFLDDGLKLSVVQLSGYCMVALNSREAYPWSDMKERYLFFMEIMLSEYRLSGRYPFIINETPFKDINKYEDDNNIYSIVVFLG